MASNLQQTLDDPLYRNWVTGGLALKITKDGLQRYVESEIHNFQQNVMADICRANALPANTVCNICTTQNVLPCPTRGICPPKGGCNYHNHGDPAKRHMQCPTGVCNTIRDRITNSHSYGSPSWRNTDAQHWGSNSWEWAKCYMPPAGYGLVTSATDTDFSGIVSVVVNHTEFQKTVAENLTNTNNIFCQARTIRNEIMHNSTFQIPDAVLHAYIDTMIQLLGDSKHLATDTNAQDAIDKLKQIKTDSLIVTAEDGIKMRAQALQAIEEKKQDILEIGRDSIDRIEEKKHDAIHAIELASTGQTEHLRPETNDEVKHSGSKHKSKQTYSNKDLQRNLIKLYEKNYLKTSAYPLMPEEDDANIGDMYVKPCLRRVNNPFLPSSEYVHSYRDIFYKDEKPCRNIYITGNAGMGKSALCQDMISTWCSAHTKQQSRSSSLYNKIRFRKHKLSEDESTMLNFTLLFYIPLRNAVFESSIEDMIKQMYPSQHSLFSTLLLEESEKCLIVLDGLDEWSPPEHYQPSLFVSEGLPGRKVSPKCTILTTTRPWKLEVLRLRNSEIDLKIQLTGLDDNSSKKLIESTVKVLNKKHSRMLNACDFEKELKKYNVHEIKTIPVILKQLICLWHNGKSLGGSQCDIYSGMLNLLIEMADKNLNKSPEFVKMKERWQNSTIQLPRCFDEKTKCKEIAPLLHSLGKLAFEALFNKKPESSLVFESSTAEPYWLSKIEIDVCLKVGILSQSKLLAGSRTKKISFLHKTFQELFAAMFISTSAESVARIFSICDSVDKVIEMSKVLVFVSGMNPDVAHRLSEHICDVAARDSRTRDYRQYCTRNVSEYIQCIQTCMIESVQESLDNGYNTSRLNIEDVFITSWTPAIEHLICSNKSNLKSVLVIEESHAINKIKTCLMQVESLQKLRYVFSYDGSEDIFYELVSHFKDTLISLEFGDYKDNRSRKLSTEQFSSTLNSLQHLQSLRLSDNALAHDQIECLMSFLSASTQMKDINLDYLSCTDCKGDCSYQLDLSQLRTLQGLTLERLNADNIQVTTSELQRCRIIDLCKPCVTESLVQCLQGAPKLQEIKIHSNCELQTIDTLIPTLSTLWQLKHIKIGGINFSHGGLKLSPEMKNLEEVVLYHVNLTSKALLGFLGSIPDTQQSVKFELDVYIDTPADEAMDYIKKCSRFSVVRCYSYKSYGKMIGTKIEFSTVNNKTDPCLEM